MTDPSDQTTLEPWQRFTLLDALLLQASVAVGFSVVYSLWPGEEGWIYNAFSSVAFGVVVAGPIVLTVQWTLRGRRKIPTVGEQLWLASFLCWFVGTCLTLLLTWLDFREEFSDSVSAGVALAVPMCAMLVVQTIFSVHAVLQLVKSKTRNDGRSVPCEWTDRFGSVACLGFGLWLWTPPMIGVFDWIRQ